MDVECRHCGKTAEETELSRCRVCHKYYCDDDKVERSGAPFCSMGCAVFFFHVDPDDPD